MIYIVRRKIDDKYYNSKSNNWEPDLDQQCWLSKEEINIFKERNSNTLNDYLIYTILNPSLDV